MTSIRRSSCLATWSTSAQPASTVSVIRERPTMVLGPTVIVWMLKPRRRIMPLTRDMTPGWFSTVTASRRRRSCTIGQLPEVVQALAEGHDRVDVGLRVDPEVDQEGTLGPLRNVEGGRDLVELVDPAGGQAIGLGELDEVRHLGEVDLGADAAVEVVLELADHPQREVVEEHDLDVELVLDRDRQLLRRHHEAAFAGDAPDVLVGAAELGADRCRKG